MIKYNSFGEDSLLSVIFLHGAFVTSEMWNSQINYFKRFYRVFTIDIRGHGENSHEKIGDDGFSSYVEDLKGVIDSLKSDKKPVICGISFSGMIAQYFSVQYPDKYSGLILCDTAVTLRYTLWDKLMFLLFPQWLMALFLKLSNKDLAKNGL